MKLNCSEYKTSKCMLIAPKRLDQALKLLRYPLKTIEYYDQKNIPQVVWEVLFERKLSLGKPISQKLVLKLS